MSMKGINIDDISLEDIYNYLESNNQKLRPEIARYMQLMDKVFNMDCKPVKFGSKEIIIKHLIKFEGLSRYMAMKIYDDAMEYFYSQSNITKDAHRNRIAERQDKLVSMAIEMVEDVNDVFKIMKANADLVKILNLDKEEPLKLEDDEWLKPFKVLSMDGEKLGLPGAFDREELEEWLQTLPELPEKTKELILQEALVKPLKLFPPENEDLRKS